MTIRLMRKRSNPNALGAFLGTIVEYYDYSLYGFAAAIIADKFFSSHGDQLSKLVNVFAVYAITYFSKPIGTYIFGRIGDEYSRKTALSITIIGMVVPTVVIGLLPEYSQIGAWSTIILAMCRFVQGIFVAGEYDGAAIYVIEHLGSKYHFTASSATRFTGVIGLLLGIGSTNLFGSRIFPEWGWRVPFLLSLPLSCLVLYYRNRLDETPEFKVSERTATDVGFYSVLKKRWKFIIMMIFLAGGVGATYQISVIFMKQYLPMVLPQTAYTISTFSVLIVVCFAVFMPITGYLADQFGISIVLKIATACTLLSSLFFIVAVYYQITNLGLISSLALAASISPFNGLAHGIFIKSIPVRERYRVVSFGHTMGSMMVSGTASYTCLLVMKLLNSTIFPIIYLSVFALIAYCMATLINKHHNKILNKTSKSN